MRPSDLVLRRCGGPVSSAARRRHVSYYIAKRLPGSFPEAVAAVRAALKTEGFGVLTEIDVRATLKERMGVESCDYVILGACNPPFAHRALELEERIGLMLPCNVIVRETSDGGIEVAAVDPMASMQAVANPALGELGAEVLEKMKKVVARA